MRFAISIPQFVADGGFDPAALRTYLAPRPDPGYWDTLEGITTRQPALPKSPWRR